MKINSLKINIKAVSEGVLHHTSPTSSIRIARWDNPAHIAFKRELHKKYAELIDAKMVSEEVLKKELSYEWQFIITELNGYKNDDGSDFVATADSISEMALDPAFQDFFNEVETFARKASNYREVNIQKLGNDSPDSSNGR